MMPNHVLGCKASNRMVRTSALDGYLMISLPKFESHGLVLQRDIGKSRPPPCSLPSDTTEPEITVLGPSPFAWTPLKHVALQQKPSLDARFPDSIGTPWQHIEAAILVTESSLDEDKRLQYWIQAHCRSWTIINSLVSWTCCNTFSCKWSQDPTHFIKDPALAGREQIKLDRSVGTLSRLSAFKRSGKSSAQYFAMLFQLSSRQLCRKLKQWAK